MATINMWGVVVLGFDWADHIDERFQALAEMLSRNENALDVVLLQEAWKDGARRDLIEDLRVIKQFPYRVDAVETPGGSGLAILSAHPIEDVRFLRFQARGNCFRFWEGDYIGGKGALAIQIRLGETPVWIANTHLIACYPAEGASEQSCDESDPNGPYREEQIDELKGFLAPLVAEAPVLIGGDFNFTRTSRYYEEMTSGEESGEHPGATASGPTSGWSEPGETCGSGDRLDYVWSHSSGDHVWHPLSPMQKLEPDVVTLKSGWVVPLSDHPALMSRWCLSSPTESCAASASPIEDQPPSR